MPLYLYILIFILWFLSALADYGQFCYIWQLKEYRLDRLEDYGSTISGKKFFHGWRVLGQPLICLALFLLWPVNLKSLAIALIAVLFINLLYNLRALAGRNLQRPKFTIKATALIIFSLLTEGILFFLFINMHLIFLVLALR